MQKRSGHGDIKNNDARLASSETIGAYLRNKRISLDITLEEVSDVTGISTAVLQALENGDKEHLPAEVYIKAFYNKYTDHLGLNFEDTYSKYQQQAKSLEKSGNRYHFNTVITLKGHERKNFAGFLRRLFLPTVILVSGVLLYWIYKNYLAAYNPLGFFREHISDVYAFLPTEVSAFFC